MISNAAKNFNILAISLNFQQSCVDDLIKLFLDLYLNKILNLSIKSFFS